jgi:hypothetical protein
MLNASSPPCNRTDRLIKRSTGNQDTSSLAPVETKPGFVPPPFAEFEKEMTQEEREMLNRVDANSGSKGASAVSVALI